MTLTSFGNSARSTNGTLTVSGYSVLDGSLTTSTDLTTTGTFSYVTKYVPGQSIWAFGIAISPPPSTSIASTSIDSGAPSASSNISPSTAGTSPGTQASGLSSGASAGIAIGALIAVIFIALGIWFLYRRGVKKRRGGDSSTGSSGQNSYAGETGEEQQTSTPVQWRPDEYIPQRSPVEVHETDFRRHELYEHEQRSPVEVHADNNFRRHELPGSHHYPELS